MRLAVGLQLRLSGCCGRFCCRRSIRSVRNGSWFVGLGVDEAVWVPTVFTKNRDRWLEADVARKFLAELTDHNELRGLLSDEHFSVDGTQIAAWASMKSFRAKDGSDDPPGSGPQWRGGSS